MSRLEVEVREWKRTRKMRECGRRGWGGWQREKRGGNGGIKSGWRVEAEFEEVGEGETMWIVLWLAW